MSKMEEMLSKINKEVKEDIAHAGLSSYTYTRIPFTSPRMNYCTFGGLPVGKLIEFYGEEHGGKTTTALDIVANYQNMEDARGVLYCDCENTLDAEWAKKIGVDVDSLYLLQPTGQSAEQILQWLIESIETDEIGLVILDSIGAMVSQQELERDIAEKTYAGISNALTRFSKLAEMACQKHRCTFIGINQIRQDLGAMYAGAISTPGGKAWKHLCAARFQFSRGKFVDSSGNELTRSAESPAGNIVMMSMTKNKTCPPTRRTGFYTLNYSIGIDYLKDLVDVAIKYGIIDKRGAWYDIVDIETGEVLNKGIHGMSEVNALIESNTELQARIEELIDNEMFKG